MARETGRKIIEGEIHDVKVSLSGCTYWARNTCGDNLWETFEREMSDRKHMTRELGGKLSCGMCRVGNTRNWAKIFRVGNVRRMKHLSSIKVTC